MATVSYEIRYKDGVIAEFIDFHDWNENDILKKLDETIAEYNENPNVDYHITMENIKRIDADEDDYYTSATSRDYSPSNPWDAPGMSVKDFI